MKAEQGDRIVVDSNKVGTPARGGEIVEVMSGPDGDRYLVRWDDGHQSVYRPAAGASVVVEKA